jgi:NADPH:quinone reductase-like Zn-dependent oxidoreductase
VVSVGPGVTDFRVGDYVGYTGIAAQAEYTAVETSQAVKVPEGVEPGLTAASLIQGLTALTLIRESHEVKKVSWHVYLATGRKTNKHRGIKFSCTRRPAAWGCGCCSCCAP